MIEERPAIQSPSAQLCKSQADDQEVLWRKNKVASPLRSLSYGGRAAAGLISGEASRAFFLPGNSTMRGASFGASLSIDSFTSGVVVCSPNGAASS